MTYLVKKVPNTHVLIVAAGNSTRFCSSADRPKQYQTINGTSILRRTIDIFLNCDDVATIQCVIGSNHKKWFKDATYDLELPSPIIGGNTRKDSVFNGLKSLSTNNHIQNNDIILIHDAARPLLSQNDLNNLITALKNNRAATLAAPVSATLRNNESGYCGEIVNRTNLWQLQTPQGFRFEDILKAHEVAHNDIEYTDDTSLVQALNIDVAIIEGSAQNFKITTKDDFTMAQAILNNTTQTRTGLGFDVHAFDPTSSGPIRICGIDIEHKHALKGHSDADVGLHAITDAILGAIGEGDIGQHFPPSDNAFKDMDSAIFLKKANALLFEKHGAINNIDITLICERPKIGSHAPKMRQRVASILDLNESQINIKATTTEQLGFTGREEGIAAQAIVSLELPV